MPKSVSNVSCSTPTWRIWYSCSMAEEQVDVIWWMCSYMCQKKKKMKITYYKTKFYHLILSFFGFTIFRFSIRFSCSPIAIFFCFVIFSLFFLSFLSAPFGYCLTLTPFVHFLFSYLMENFNSTSNILKFLIKSNLKL